MKLLKKRWLLLLVLLAEVLLLAGCAVRAATNERYERKLQGESIVGEAQAIALERGSYEIEIAYQTKEDGVYCQAVRGTSHGWMEGERIPLPKERNQKRFEVRLTESTEHFFILVQTKAEEPTDEIAVIEQVAIRETMQTDTACVTLLLVFSLLADALWLFWKNGRLENLSPQQKSTALGLLGIWVVASVPLFVNYMITGDDFLFHVMRIEGIAEGLKAGQFPVKMQPGWLNDYGYPVSVMYGDILLYLPALLRIAGFTLQTAYKCYVFVINGITAWSAYYCAKKITGERTYGLLGSLLYTVSAYRILNVYFRCSVGEYTAMAFFPLVFVGLHMLLHTEEKRKGQLCLIVAYTLILQSHLLSCEMILLFSALYCILQWKRLLRELWHVLQAALASLVINLGFLVPFFNYMKTQDLWIKGNSSNLMQEHGLFLSQLFQTFAYGGGGSATVADGVAADMPLGLGLAFAVILALFVWEMLVYGKRIRTAIGTENWWEQRSIFVMLLLAILMSCYFFPWKKVGKIPFIGNALTVYQFAWRFLAMAVALGSVLGGLAIKNLQNLCMKEHVRIWLLVVGLLALVQGSYLIDSRMASAEVYYVTSTAGMDSVYAVSGGEYLLQGAQRNQTYDTQIYGGENVVIESATRKAEHFWITCENPGEEESWVKVPLFAYYGYRAYDAKSREELMLSFDEDRILKVILPSGYRGEVEVVFQEPMRWRLAEIVSLAGVLALLLACGSRYVTRKQKKV